MARDVLKQCRLCGAPGTNTCIKCGSLVCDNCYDKGTGLCRACFQGRQSDDQEDKQE